MCKKYCLFYGINNHFKLTLEARATGLGTSFVVEVTVVVVVGSVVVFDVVETVAVVVDCDVSAVVVVVVATVVGVVGFLGADIFNDCAFEAEEPDVDAFPP